jgi:hypothetical protein
MSRRTQLLKKLEAGDPESVEDSDAVADLITDHSEAFARVFNGMMSDNPEIRLKCADAIQKAAARCPDRIQPHKMVLIEKVARIDHNSLRWHVAQLLPLLQLDEDEARKVLGLLKFYLSCCSSRVVQVEALDGLFELGRKHERFRPVIIKILEQSLTAGEPAVELKALKLLKILSR